MGVFLSLHDSCIRDHLNKEIIYSDFMLSINLGYECWYLLVNLSKNQPSLFTFDFNIIWINILFLEMDDLLFSPTHAY